MVKEGDWMVLSAEDCVRVGNYLYFISIEYSIVFRLQLSDGKIEIVDCIPDEYVDAKRLGSKIVLWEDSLFFAPMNGKNIWRYSIHNSEWKRYELKKIKGLNDYCRIFQAVQYDGKIYFIGCNYPAITVLNPTTDEIEYIEGPYNEYREREFIEDDVFFRTDCVVIDNFFYVASCLSNTILKFDMNSYKYEYISIGLDSFRFSGIDYDGKDFYIAPRKRGPLLRWDGNDCVKTIDLPFEDKVDGITFGNVVCQENKVILAMNIFSINGNSIEIDKGMGDLEYDIQEIYKKYYFYRKIGKDLYVSLDDREELTVISEKKVLKYKMIIDDTEVVDFLKKKKNDKVSWVGFCKNTNMYSESKTMSLSFFLDIV